MYLKFIGTGGSMGLKHNGVYKCKVMSDDGYIYVKWLVDKNTTRECPYSSPQSFARNWEKA